MEFHCIKISQYFPKPYEPFGRDVNFKVDLSNRATKSDVKNISNIDTSRFALKSTLASFKTEVDKLDIDKLVPVPVDLSKLSDVVKYVVKKDVYNAKIKDVQNKIPNITNLATNTTLNVKRNEIKSEIPSITNFAATATFNAEITEIKHKIPNMTNVASY